MTTQLHDCSSTSKLRPLLATGTRYILPPLRCSGPEKVHPDYPEIYERNAAWVREYIPRSGSRKTVEYLMESRIPFFDCLVYPFCIADRVFQSSCVASLMVSIDDLSDLRRIDFDDISNGGSSDRYGRAFSVAFGVLRAHMTDTVYERYVQSWKDVFASGAKEHSLRARNEIPDIDTYLRIRSVTAGAGPYITGAEYALDIDLTDLFGEDPAFRAVQNLVAENFVLVNDLFSFRKELFKGDPINIVASLMSVHGHDLQGAVEFVCDRITSTDRALNQGCRELRSLYAGHPRGAQVDAYLVTLQTICSGNFRWSLETTRYHGCGYVWNGLRSGIVTLNPNIDRIASL